MINDKDKRYASHLGKSHFINVVMSDAEKKKSLAEKQNRDRPSTQDEYNKFSQMEEGKELFYSGVEYTNEELRARGFYVLRQYLVEKRKHDVAMLMYKEGQNAYYDKLSFDMVPNAFKNNNDFWNGYFETAGYEWYMQGKALDEAFDLLRDNISFISGYKLAMVAEEEKHTVK